MARLVIALAASAAALTQEEAQCVASFNGGQTFVMSGDSNMRYEFLALNEFVEKGTVMSSLSRNGDKNKGQIDTLSFWTDVPIPQYDPLRTKDGSHMRRMDKKYKSGGSASFFFLQKTWQDFFGDSKGPKQACAGARNCVMIYNTQRPTEEPGDPTRKPTKKPTPQPSRAPTYKPSAQPSREPTDKPTPKPSTSKPTPQPTTPKPTNTPLGCPRVRLADDCPRQRPPSCGAGGHAPGDFCEGDGACEITDEVKNCAYASRRRLQDESNAAVYVVRVAAPTMAPTAKPRPKKSSSSASDVPAWGFAVAAAALVLFVVAICACYVAGKEARACLDGDERCDQEEDVKPRRLPSELRKARSQGPLPAKVDYDSDSDDDLARLRMLRAKKGLPPILREETKVGDISPLTPEAKRRSRGRASTPDAEALAAAAAASSTRRPDRRRGLGPADGLAAGTTRADGAGAGSDRRRGLGPADAAAGTSAYWARKSPDRRAAPAFSPATGRAPPPSTRSLAAAGAAAGAGAALARRRSSDMDTVRRSTSDMDRSAPSPPRAHRRTPSDMDIRGDSPVDLEMAAGAGARGLARDRRRDRSPPPPRDVAWSPPRTSSESRRPREAPPVAPPVARSASSHSSARSPSYYRDRASRTASRDYSRPSRQTSAETFATPSSLAYAAPAASRPDRRRGLGPADGAGAAGSTYAAPAAPRRSAPRAVAYATCVDAFRAVRPGELSLRAGDRVAILDSSDAVWWTGSCRGASGKFPCYHVDHVSTSPDASVVAPRASPRRYY
ncbi:unnamed protein product [Pelagomonas calceolata]|uniref:SH3 domain-containing protein n=1 Tax=Pelagomonas calceolata TaxID=35677 RepID=A0A8J2WL06_9STRA|nr:unnamed protein product [Pelagomonas calceolata]